MSDNLWNKIFDVTNGGLDIILRYYPHAKEGRNFKVREERTPSASLKKDANGVYKVTDFGDDSIPRNAIEVAAKEEGRSFRDALLDLAKQYNVLEGKPVYQAEFRKKKITEIEYEFDESGYYFEYNNDVSKEELDVLGPFVTDEVCKRYRLYSVKFYAKKRENDIMEIHSTEFYPIFAFVNKTRDGKEWIKVYQPKAEDKQWRFRYVGGRPADFVFGLDYIEKKFKELNAFSDDLDEESDGEPKETKLERIVIGSGDRDSLNLAGSGELVIWLNSETANFDTALYAKLKSMAKKIINVPDIDKTGRIQGTELAMQYMDVYTAWLPDYLAASKDFRGNSKKDFLDFCNMFRHNPYRLKNEVRLLLDNAKCCQFWDVKYTKNGTNYEFNNVNAYYFLSLAGFHRMEAPENKNDYVFIRAENHLIYRINYLQVKDFVNTFLEEKQRSLGERIIPNSLRNMIYNSNKMSESSLVNLPTKQPDFKDFSDNWQMLFFRNQVWKITKDGIKSEDTDKLQQNVWTHDVIDEKVERTYNKKIDGRKIFIDEPYFRIFKDKEDNYDIEILKKDCEFLNYLINVSRVHWGKEKLAISTESEEDQEKYWNENRFNIAGKGLTEDEIHEQKLHLINKIFIYGYLLHRYKDPAKPWAVYLMDNEVVSDDESHGGTGKSLFSNSPRIFMDTKVLASRNAKLFENNFLFDGVTEHTDYFLFDDASKYFKFDNLYTTITGDLNVNPKNNQPYIVPFAQSPKFAISTNYSLRSTEPSTMRRLLVGAFSDWYHYADGRDRTAHDPVKDFGHKLFDGWDDMQWNSFFNFAAQCCQFFLGAEEKISAPDASVMKRNSLANMGPAFQAWADIYFADFLNDNLEGETYMAKQEALDNLKDSVRVLSSTTPNLFYKKLESWCIYNDVILNPKEKLSGKDNRIFKWVDQKSVEYYYLLKTTPDDNTQLPDAPTKTDDLEDLDF